MGETQLPWRPPRACDVYLAEFKHCKSLSNRFHHYYTYGTSPVCLQWKDDFEACREWERNCSPHAKESLQKSERNRVSEQKNFPPFWEMRKKPPADWHLPLNEAK
ncbi:hypothetical protein Q7C36_005144 [Tachysurus vachellii]|uniref:Synaptic plasticity regulator PANTS n=1 Tax=Tachysurus vachellii TaxID=175792 RepID=A0AA88NR95_TACVA|nr:UPF0545 protein C22orf39 homolog [Tachysurus fulvidraco]XP_060729366.1 UPF0545 protein C22orf39 homolog [Tachysurus vachellii]KAK2860978.1 hypothetical protein Q7C36_005144 [Tachysurus vachellii]